MMLWCMGCHESVVCVGVQCREILLFIKKKAQGKRTILCVRSWLSKCCSVVTLQVGQLILQSNAFSWSCTNAAES